ncbi:unknown protein [Seminavis robusta]|uniref:Uncharacterized protein n=1 Tax=Seminavis robusta TaxID=568900 RepID=A0A9N8DLK9_9STRA|nr:unknown protein [Seminavis robusta]|eukprot:Sro210_g087500.1 n/a (131) ;mRNA; r:6919-7311
MKFNNAFTALASLAMAAPVCFQGMGNANGNAKNSLSYKGTITVTNLAPDLETCNTPVWIGIHGPLIFTTVVNQLKTADGNAGPLNSAFDAADGAVDRAVMKNFPPTRPLGRMAAGTGWNCGEMCCDIPPW